jgi:AcrR family transcriptional regulator
MRVVPTPRRMTRDDRRAALLETAAELVDAEGVGALTFERLADRAGVAKTLPYAYFDTKDQILLTLFDRVIGRLDDEVAAVLASGDGFDAIVRRSLEVWFDATRDHGRLVGALLDGRSLPGLADAVRRRDRESDKAWHDLVAEHFDLADGDAHLLAAMLTRTATATVQLWLARRGARTALIDSFVVMASGAAAGLQRGS